MPGPGIPGLVSIIIPCYNRADIVGETIESVLRQSYGRFEAILVDDGSTDGTREVIRTYNSDPRIRYFYKLNGGLSSARNCGLEAARGEFIAFLDSDDLWEDWKLAAQMEIFRRHSDVGLIWTDMSTFSKAGQVLSERHLRTYYSAYALVNFEGEKKAAGVLSELIDDAPERFGGCPYYVTDVFQDMFNGNLVHPSTAIVRRDRLRKSGRFEPEVTGLGAEDYHFYFRICSHGPVAFLDVPTTQYRLHPTQLSTCNRLHEARGNLNVVMHWLERRPSSLPQPVIHRSLASSHAWLGSEELNAGNTRAATRHLWQSLRLQKSVSTTRLFFLSLLPTGATRVLRAIKRAAVSPLVKPLTGLALLLGDDDSLLFHIVDLLQSQVVTS